uniref:CUB and zona pellucida-like domains 1, tandem duplicate 1 n=1 Tax=Neogobius melanostomus TaxID=47308 RepID=A0A8C6U604_9GOBI
FSFTNSVCLLFSVIQLTFYEFCFAFFLCHSAYCYYAATTDYPHVTGNEMIPVQSNDTNICNVMDLCACYLLGGSCGGSLSGSGSFSSPNYPGYYHDNANCVWQIRASSDQNLYLTFTYLQLENCCSCDYIAVYDGPSEGSRLLGTVCNDNDNYNNNTQSSFHSSSNYLTVVFRTDGSVVGRGFNAEFTSSLTPNLGTNDLSNCSSDNMNIVISRSYLNSLGIDANNLYINDQYCRPDISYYSVVFNFPINTCGTVRKFDHGRIVYTNALRSFSSDYGEITRQSLFRLNVSCRMEQDSVSQIIYEVRHHDNVSISGSGRYNTSMAFYTSSSFYYQVTQVPYQVSLNQDLYVQVSQRRGDSSLVLFLDTCVASSSPHDFQTRSYDLIRNGCRVDSTFYSYSSGTRPYAQFRFKAFQFLRATDHVYIQCKVLICPASDYNSRCRRGCSRRKARDLGSEHESETVVLGPIQLQGEQCFCCSHKFKVHLNFDLAYVAFFSSSSTESEKSGAEEAQQETGAQQETED